MQERETHIVYILLKFLRSEDSWIHLVDQSSWNNSVRCYFFTKTRDYYPMLNSIRGEQQTSDQTSEIPIEIHAHGDGKFNLLLIRPWNIRATGQKLNFIDGMKSLHHSEISLPGYDTHLRLALDCGRSPDKQRTQDWTAGDLQLREDERNERVSERGHAVGRFYGLWNFGLVCVAQGSSSRIAVKFNWYQRWPGNN